ncbi:MAG: hypothetical protein PUP46_01955 [Endozoicomonas sp. (ex Botrylloides leachii)]|nr:hypothetical protein [Endozoicomonas sp. (ex Botrylloides leachii)]
MTLVKVACIHCYQAKDVVQNGKQQVDISTIYAENVKKACSLNTAIMPTCQIHKRIVDMTMNGYSVRGMVDSLS